jgi:hypothetical protein
MPAIKPKIRRDLAVVELDGEVVIYNDDDGSLHHLNPTASIVFSCFDGTATIRELSIDLAEAFSMPADEIERQVRTLQRDFRKKGLLERTKSTNGVTAAG